MTEISIVGLGLMGTALAGTLLKAGHEVTVWNRTDSKTEPLVAMGARRAANLAEAVRPGSLVIVCVLDYDTVHGLLGQTDLRGVTLVNLTSGRPEEARRTAEWAEARGAGYLDGGVMAVPQMIGAPGALILYSGSREAFDRFAEPLGHLAEARFVDTDPGLAPLLDMAMLTGMYGQIAGITQGFALVRSAGLPLGDFASTLLVPWLRAMGELAHRWAKEVDAGQWGTDVANLGVNKVALDSIALAMREQGIEGNLLAPFKHLVDKRVADGHQDQGLQSLVEELHPGT
ncbi:NAD(P)-dependent oxidoreductase [Nonomuraea endophytica]|uniref:NAD(P)-dependent oxidoreductase n=1 Tax=Nonomuraea endophytica TaxID=714136 RepID=UPI0037C87467